ncbi:hypothetical protein FHW67_003002 [Herbaspirillum sp. Sphag1AN]|uniref:hypothetical protein n=1 Tax=unclassified Herbaspirillum TaxID=2624150 RepID=UPI00160AFC63|nr:MULTISPECIES: hypothetical protein [unclassified Herbaspirillum]MBB3213701.1 hypothetical protein [Herbaspirillum sp. Sphag1AN]MBB3246898.1 hypothetical protein [Herbaspirillum sp. Sphag64]
MNKSKFNLFFLFLFIINFSFASAGDKNLILFSKFNLSIPENWVCKFERENCISVSPSIDSEYSILQICHEDEFTQNFFVRLSDNEWIPNSEGYSSPIKPKIFNGVKYLKANIYYRTSDEAGMHLNNGLIADIIFENGAVISFFGKGDESDFKLYENIIYSININ